MLGADTEVVCDGRILGKPEDAAEARRDAGGARGPRARGGDRPLPRRAVSAALGRRADARPLRPDERSELAWYAATGEPLDKAGAYHVDGLGALFVESVSGSPSNVAGLPVRLLLRLARESGLDLGWPVA